MSVSSHVLWLPVSFEGMPRLCVYGVEGVRVQTPAGGMRCQFARRAPYMT